MTWTMFFAAVLISVLGRIIGEDAKTLIPRLSRFLLRKAASRIGGDFGAGFYEEWLAHLDETPELTLKLWHALTIYFWGAGRICREVGYEQKALRRYDAVKRAIDVGLVSLSVPHILPIIVVMALATRLSGRKAFVSKEFVGQDGRSISMWKIGTFRKLKSTEIDVYRQTEERFRYRSGSDYFVVTKIGRVLRITSLDELPQLWNVLKGDISLVGPRMLTKEQINLYGVDGYVSVKPGISGLSQVLARPYSECDWVKLDQHYCSRRSLILDLQILFETVSFLVRRTGY